MRERERERERKVDLGDYLCHGGFSSASSTSAPMARCGVVLCAAARRRGRGGFRLVNCDGGFGCLFAARVVVGPGPTSSSSRREQRQKRKSCVGVFTIRFFWGGGGRIDRSRPFVRMQMTGTMIVVGVETDTGTHFLPYVKADHQRYNCCCCSCCESLQLRSSTT
jgi:hypothetical protein